jgi:cytochrome P450
MGNPLQGPEFYRNPYPAYAELRGSGPVQRIPGGGDGRVSYLVTGYDEARSAFNDPRLSKDTARFFAGKPSTRDLHPAVSQTMLASDPPQHTRLRRLVARAFTPGTIAGLRPYIQSVTDGLVDALVADGRADLVEDLAVPLPVTVICQLLGVPEADRSAVRGWSNELFAAGQPERTDAASHAIADYMAGLVDAKRRAPDDGLLTELVAARDGEDKLSEAELVSLAVLLLVAGHETTSNFIGNAALALFQDPQALHRLRGAPELLSSVLDELLRFDSPVGIATFRYSTEPLTLGGVDIPAGMPVLIAPGAANRDPARFPDPGRLDLTRDAKSHLAFGHGIHRCLGAPLAKLEAEIALGSLLALGDRLRLAVPAEELEWRHTRLMRGLRSLPVVITEVR